MPCSTVVLPAPKVMTLSSSISSSKTCPFAFGAEFQAFAQPTMDADGDRRNRQADGGSADPNARFNRLQSIVERGLDAASPSGNRTTPR